MSNLRRWTVLSRTTSDERIAIRKSIDEENMNSWKGFLISWIIAFAVGFVLSLFMEVSMFTLSMMFLIAYIYRREANESRRKDWKEPNITEMDYLRPIPEEEFE